ncbi:3-hydroxyacyl-ACP dehydratase [Brumimicrobium aurantiacum]|uniref:3-hydroxyacyl-ACP dehydratase n=2 Tax=Brumimicrobium aurantiacum TaxID=1737063 RepID=A0A3E1F0L1_9FLAO|nr:3-hydroxyacyl-ACP dehydratase [Brumimicrobium aurantiacum]
MLLKGFYTIKEIVKVSEKEYNAFIHLNKDHEIFLGHFPGNPVVPGVCMVQVLKELTSEITAKKLIMNTSNNIKFMSLINPNTSPEIKLSITLNTDNEDIIKVKNICYIEDKIALKMSVKYSIL